MTSRVVANISTKTLNGLGSFVLPCKKITLRFCNSGGSSRGMRDFLVKDLKAYAEKNPKIEFIVKKEAGHPIIQGEYTNGNQKTICVRNMDSQKIAQKLEVLKSSSGAQLKKYVRPVESVNTSVRGIWSPFHVEKEYRYKI